MANRGQKGPMIFNILNNTTDLWMTKYIIGEIFSSGGATLYKNSSDQTVLAIALFCHLFLALRSTLFVDQGSSSSLITERDLFLQFKRFKIKVLCTSHCGRNSEYKKGKKIHAFFFLNSENC